MGWWSFCSSHHFTTNQPNERVSDTGQRKPFNVLLWTSRPPGPPKDASPVGSGLAASALCTAQHPPALVICSGTYSKKKMRGRREGPFRVQRDSVKRGRVAKKEFGGNWGLGVSCSQVLREPKCLRKHAVRLRQNTLEEKSRRSFWSKQEEE